MHQRSQKCQSHDKKVEEKQEKAMHARMLSRWWNSLLNFLFYRELDLKSSNQCLLEVDRPMRFHRSNLYHFNFSLDNHEFHWGLHELLVDSSDWSSFWGNHTSP